MRPNSQWIVQWTVAVLIACSLAPGANAQRRDSKRPKSSPQKLSKKERDRREALRAFAEGRILLRQNRLFEAIEAYEKSARLEPTDYSANKQLIHLYAMLGRTKEAVSACRKVLKLKKTDAGTWLQLAQLLKSQQKTKEARAALESGLKRIKVNGEPRILSRIHRELGLLQQEQGALVAAVTSFSKSSDYLQKRLRNLADGAPIHTETIQRRAELHERIGQIYVLQKQFKKAVRAYQQAQTIHPDGAVRWNLNLAQIYTQLNKYEKALEHIDAYLCMRPQSVKSYNLKIRLLEKLGRSEHVLKWLQVAAKKDRFNNNLRILLAQQSALRGRPKQAEKIYLQLIADDANEQNYALLFRLYQSARGFGVHRVLQKIDQIALQANDESDVIGSERAKGHLRGMIGALQADKNLSLAVVHTVLPLLDKKNNKLTQQTIQLLTVLSDDNKMPKQSEKLYRALLRFKKIDNETAVYAGLLRALWRTGRHTEIIRVCRMGLAKTKKQSHILFHSELARTLARTGKKKEALESADRALACAGDSRRFAMERLRIGVLIQVGETSRAEQECFRLLKKYKAPQDIHEIRHLLSHVYSVMRNFPKAEKQLQLILKMDPSNAGACNDLGYFWADQGKNLEKAEALIRKAIALDRRQRTTFTTAANDPVKDRAAYIDSLGWVLFRRGKIAQARLFLEKATRLPGGDDPDIWDHLGDVYAKLKLPGKALKCWAKALELYKANPARGSSQRDKAIRQKIKAAEKSN